MSQKSLADWSVASSRQSWRLVPRALVQLRDRCITLDNQAVDRLICRPDFKWSHLHARMFRHQRDGMVQVTGFQQQNAAECSSTSRTGNAAIDTSLAFLPIRSEVDLQIHADGNAAQRFCRGFLFCDDGDGLPYVFDQVPAVGVASGADDAAVDQNSAAVSGGGNIDGCRHVGWQCDVNSKGVFRISCPVQLYGPAWCGDLPFCEFQFGG